MTSIMRMSQKLVFHQSKCISAIKRILSTTAMHVSSSFFMHLCIPYYCNTCSKSSAVVPKVCGTTPLGAVRNSKGVMKQEWAVGGLQ